MHKLTFIPNSKCILGEGPLYKENENSLYWSDIKDKRIYKYDLNSKTVEHFQFTKNIGSFVFTSENKLLATTNEGYEYLDLETKEISPLINPEEELINNRFNDGKCDAKGRYFAGSMDNNEEKITGSLYCLDKNICEKKEKDLFISNGLGWNKNSSKFYLTDSPKRVIYVYDYDLETSTMSNKQIFVRIKDEDGYPDGLCLDEEDYIWSAHWAGSKITRYKPDGSIDKIIELPVPNVTSCCFGGKDFKTLFITSAQKGLSYEELLASPLSGNTFILETNVKGQKPNLYQH